MGTTLEKNLVCDTTGPQLHVTGGQNVSVDTGTVNLPHINGTSVDIRENAKGGFSGSVTATNGGVSLTVPVTDHSGSPAAREVAKQSLKICHTQIANQEGLFKQAITPADLSVTPDLGKITPEPRIPPNNFTMPIH
jgi:hypothetical protein